MRFTALLNFGVPGWGGAVPLRTSREGLNEVYARAWEPKDIRQHSQTGRYTGGHVTLNRLHVHVLLYILVMTFRFCALFLAEFRASERWRWP